MTDLATDYFFSPSNKSGGAFTARLGSLEQILQSVLQHVADWEQKIYKSILSPVTSQTP